LSTDKILHISCSNLNDSVLISECHVFVKADSQADYAGPQAPHKHCWEVKNEWKNSFHIPAYRRFTEIQELNTNVA